MRPVGAGRGGRTPEGQGDTHVICLAPGAYGGVAGGGWYGRWGVLHPVSTSPWGQWGSASPRVTDQWHTALPGGRSEFSFRGWGGGVLEAKSPKVCVPKPAKSMFPFVNFMFSHHEIQVRGVGVLAPPPPQETLSC